VVISLDIMVQVEKVFME